MTVDELKAAAEKDGLLTLTLRPHLDAKQNLVWRAVAAKACDRKRHEGIDADPWAAVCKAVAGEAGDVFE